MLSTDVHLGTNAYLCLTDLPGQIDQAHNYSFCKYCRLPEAMPFFKITLIRSSIGLPKKTQGVLNALGLRKRMATVFKPVNPSTAGQIMRIKELVAVSEVEEAMTDAEMREMRKPDPGYYIEKPAVG